MKCVFDLSKKQVTIEGGGAELLEVLKMVQQIAPKLSRIELIGTASAIEAPAPQVENSDGVQRGGATPKPAPGMREFVRSIQPKNNYERVVAIATYKARFEQVDTFSPREMSAWFQVAGFELPAQMPSILFDGKRKYGYLEKSGHGKWKLSISGQNLATRRLETSGERQE